MVTKTQDNDKKQIKRVVDLFAKITLSDIYNKIVKERLYHVVAHYIWKKPTDTKNFIHIAFISHH